MFFSIANLCFFPCRFMRFVNLNLINFEYFSRNIFIFYMTLIRHRRTVCKDRKDQYWFKNVNSSFNLNIFASWIQHAQPEAFSSSTAPLLLSVLQTWCFLVSGQQHRAEHRQMPGELDSAVGGNSSSRYAKCGEGVGLGARCFVDGYKPESGSLS